MKTDPTSLPLVSCIMPTCDRRAFVPLAIAYFLRQDYPNRELIIIDDGSDSAAGLIPPDERIRYIRLPKRAKVGAKRNLACQNATGDLILHWDDDDWHAPNRIEVQVRAMLDQDSEVCGLRRMLFYEPRAGAAWLYEYPASERRWLIGGSLLYAKAFWQRAPFPNIQVGEDTRFLWSQPLERAVTIDDLSIYVASIHPGNTSPKDTGSSYWRRWDGDLRAIMGADLDRYPANGSARQSAAQENDSTPARIQSQSSHLINQEREFSMLTTALKSDLILPEFAAFNHGQSLPWMRRWEMPFVLFQAQLGNTMAVLDCTINPVNFQERLARLYPDVLYRHWNPIQNGQFVLPFGIPDDSFDRIICVNTLEHLLRDQRELLLRDMARKLKRGGRLILTCDYYFDSLWKEPSLLQLRVLRPDRQEVFNGYNRVTPLELVEICEKNSLKPAGEVGPEPLEGDPHLYRQQPPAPHACFGGVFVKGEEAPRTQSRNIALALLTWNTCAVSVDSVHAYLREASMLRRLGHQPVLIVCDNGSTDSTQAELCALDGKIDFDHRMIFNTQNLGSSIARNQLINAALEFDADYLFFMDGDIEIVPFSSVAMLRYMENSGSRLGCIGADSASWSHRREQVTPYLYSIDQLQKETTNLVAWTQYGLFRCDVFRDGVLFDETAPFDGPGWGFEDNDLAFQMETKGYLNQRFFGMTYLHRDPSSSVRMLKNNGFDVNEAFARRKQYIIDKWAPVAEINNGPLLYVRRIEVRL